MQRLTPTFFIIGERKCGTSSVYRYLLDHSQILPCRVKEPQFFSKPAWYRWMCMHRYRALFPAASAESASMRWYDLDMYGNLTSEVLTIRRDMTLGVITGEASANMFAQVPPQRLYRAFPEAKLILFLRHPVDRAFAHYRMLQRFAQEGRRLPIQLTDFRRDFVEDIRRMRSGASGYFAGPGFYAERLKAWTDVFGRARVFLIRTEDMEESVVAQKVLDDVCEFLEIVPHDFSAILGERVNVAPAQQLDRGLREELFAFYESDIAELESFTGRRFHWEP